MFATGVALKELIGILADVVEDPDTYKKIEGVRKLLCELTGKEIDSNGLIALLEETTQGEAYTGEWEKMAIDDEARRLRVAGGYIYEVRSTSNAIFVSDG